MDLLAGQAFGPDEVTGSPSTIVLAGRTLARQAGARMRWLISVDRLASATPAHSVAVMKLCAKAPHQHALEIEQGCSVLDVRRG